MSDYTPTTEEVRECYRFGMDYEQGMADDDARAEFDRWLAEVKAQAWQEGVNAHEDVTREMLSTLPPPVPLLPAHPFNPYRQGENK